MLLINLSGGGDNDGGYGGERGGGQWDEQGGRHAKGT